MVYLLVYSNAFGERQEVKDFFLPVLLLIVGDMICRIASIWLLKRLRQL